MILRSVYFWLAIGGLALLLLSKGGASKALKIIKILGTLFRKLLDIFFALLNFKLEKIMYFDEGKEA